MQVLQKQALPAVRKLPQPATRHKAARERRVSGGREGAGVAAAKRWSQAVGANSNALDLDDGVFTLKSPAAIAASLKRSADHSKRRKATPYQSAMSMLTFYINRAGKNLSVKRLHVLERAKSDLRRLYGKQAA